MPEACEIGLIEIVVRPDGSWEFYDDYLREIDVSANALSDDFKVIPVPDDMESDKIDKFVLTLV